MTNRLLCTVLGLMLAACAADAPAPRGEKKEGPTPPPPTGSFGDAPAGPSSGAQPDGLVNEVWSHSIDTLFKLDPITKQVQVVAKFSGCTSDVIDIALDESSNLFATTDNEGRNGSTGGLWSVDRKTGVCTRIASGEYPNSLSFVPRGTVDPDAEALVGFLDNNDYVRIDTKTGAITKVGTLGNVGFGSSGDLVSVKGGPTFLTVAGETCGDCLVEVDPRTGAVLKNWGPLGHPDVFGIAFWAGSVYGFDDGGQLFEVTFGGGKLATREIPIPNKQPGLQFGGAGSTTSAPVSPTR